MIRSFLLLFFHPSDFLLLTNKAHQDEGEGGEGEGAGGSAEGSECDSCLKREGQLFDGFGFTDHEGENLKIRYRP